MTIALCLVSPDPLPFPSSEIRAQRCRPPIRSADGRSRLPQASAFPLLAFGHLSPSPRTHITWETPASSSTARWSSASSGSPELRSRAATLRTRPGSALGAASSAVRVDVPAATRPRASTYAAAAGCRPVRVVTTLHGRVGRAHVDEGFVSLADVVLWPKASPCVVTVQASMVCFTVGSHVWVEDADVAWIDGLIEKVNGDQLIIKCTSGKKVTANTSSVYHKDTEAKPSGVEDMTTLAYLHEPGVLENIKSRYGINEIYTYTGNILIAVNPFQRLPHLYSNDMMEKYKGAVFGELSPHPFAISDRTYRLMMNYGISQAILVSGESGAGKTESTKMLMQYLAFMGGKVETGGRSVQQQVLESNPVLEAFGNAKTVRNNNSSRFGKFVEIQFNPNGKISGAAIRTYLLERSRVCQISDLERNYHCFYMLCAAPKDRERYKLGDPSSFHYLNQSNCIKLDTMDDSSEYTATRRAMDIVGISSNEQDAIFRVIAAILHLGNVAFSEGSEADSSVPKDDKSEFHLRTAAELFMCDEKALQESLCKRVMVTRGESIVKNLDSRAAALSRDALARIVYSRLFDWLVNKINTSIGQDHSSKLLIGVLDIYGFESFKTNSFEQFCINLTNEKLQQHFNQHVFKMEQEEYKKEEIDWSYIQFVDNQEILDLIEKKPGGIIALLDETCMMRNSSHEVFAEKLYQAFKGNPHFIKPKFSRTDFTIHHYAGEVTYQSDLFLSKNIDYAVNEHQTLLHASKCSFVSSLFPPSEESTKSKKFTSICSSFKQQLQSLLETLSKTEPHYVRCIKPNNVLKPAIFENRNVLQQLRCGGVLEAIRISCLGYPTRQTYDEFIDRFAILLPKVISGSYDVVTATKMLLEKVKLTGYQIGKTKLFLRAGQMAELDTRRAEFLSSYATKIQSKVRSNFARRNFNQMRMCATPLQTICRGQLARHHYKYLRRKAASSRIQAYYRMHFATKSYRDLLFASTTIQSGLRGMAARNELHFHQEAKTAAARNELHKKKLDQETKAAAARNELHKKKFHQETKAAVIIQNSTNGTPCSEEQMTPHDAPSVPKEACSLEKPHVSTIESKSAISVQTPHDTPSVSKGACSLEKPHDSVDALINCITENIGFCEGKPVAAVTIYKCLIHWKTFEAEKTSVFDRLIQIFGSAMQNHDSYEVLAYWLSNSSTLLIMLQKSLKVVGSSEQQRPSFLGRMFGSSPTETIIVDMGLVRQIEAKYPALLFKQQLAAIVEGLYGMICENVKKELYSLLSQAIEVARSMKAGAASLPRGHSFSNQASQWHAMVNNLKEVYNSFSKNCVPPIFILKMLTHLFKFINAQLFNSLLVHHECCSFSNGGFIKHGLAQLEAWCEEVKPEYAGPALDELSHIRQSVGFLVIFKKFRMSYDEIAHDLCPVLTIQQLYKICTQYWDDKYSTKSVCKEVLDEMKGLVAQITFLDLEEPPLLLDEEISMPISLEEMADSMDAKEFEDVIPPLELVEHPAFKFLKS